MTVVRRERSWKLELLGNEHGIPHVHLRWPDGRASIAIETGQLWWADHRQSYFLMRLDG